MGGRYEERVPLHEGVAGNVVLTVERVIGIYITGEWARARFSNVLCRTLDGAAGGMFDMREAPGCPGQVLAKIDRISCCMSTGEGGSGRTTRIWYPNPIFQARRPTEMQSRTPGSNEDVERSDYAIKSDEHAQPATNALVVGYKSLFNERKFPATAASWDVRRLN